MTTFPQGNREKREYDRFGIFVADTFRQTYWLHTIFIWIQIRGIQITVRGINEIAGEDGTGKRVQRG